jgi:Family of unknown function (DUF6461)
LLFARDLGPVELLRRMGGRPGEVVRRTAAEPGIEALSCFPDRLVVRAGTRKPWAFAIEPYGGLGGSEMVCRVSAGTAAAALMRVPAGPNFFSYAEDGRLITQFDLPFMPSMSHGADPERFLPAIRRLGLDEQGYRDEAGGWVDLDVAAARLAAAELGVRLDERTFLHAALASAAVPNPLLPDPDAPPQQLPPQATGPVFDLDDPQDRERYRQEGAHAPGTVARWTTRAKPPQRGPKAVSAGPIRYTASPPPSPGPEPRQWRWRFEQRPPQQPGEG